MSRVAYNVVANLANRLVAVALVVVLVPFYVRLLGAEAYGLIGLFTTLQIVFALADLGFGAAMTREMARLSAGPRISGELVGLMRVMERLFWMGTLVLIAAFLGGSGIVAEHWVRAQHLSIASVRHAVTLMGLSVALQLPIALYQSVLVGLQRQVESSLLQVAAGITSGGGAVVALILVSPTVECFFGWYVIATAMQAVMFRVLVWRKLPLVAPGGGRVRPRVRSLSGFALPVMMISATTVVLTQLDKIIVSRMVNLKEFGYYTLANVAAGAPTLIATPLFLALYPRLTELVARNQEDKLTTVYHRACQLAAVIVIPIGGLLVAFAQEALWAWTGDVVVARSAAPILRMLILGSTFGALMMMPYALQLAHGRTRLPLIANCIAILVCVPALVVLTRRFGTIGASWVWAALNTGYLVLWVPVMHRRILPREKWRWYRDDVAGPLLATALVVGLGRVLIDTTVGRLALVGELACLLMAATACAAANTPLLGRKGRAEAWQELRAIGRWQRGDRSL